MKIAIAGLCLLGMVAAICAALLVRGLHTTVVIAPPASTQPTATAKVTVLCAAQDLAPMTVLDGSMVTTQALPTNEVPRGYLSNSTDVVGKVVKQAMVTGQPFSADFFFEENGSRLLASVIPAGKRAVAISVTDYAGLDGLIYPGSLVDVMASFESNSANGRREATTITLLEKVQVLAFEQHTVVSPEKSLGDLDNAGRPTGGMRRVTLLVDTRQSKTLELGMRLGNLSLALRNPMDTAQADKEPITLRSMMNDEPTDAPPPPAPVTPTSLFNTPPPSTQPVETPHWDTIVMRGGTVETHSYNVPTPANHEGSKP